MLKIENLHAQVDDKDILKGLTLTVQPGEVHAIMGPNGSGKSTLAHILSGREGYQVTQGEVTYKGKNLLDLEIEQRAQQGIFLGMQYPVELPGVNNMTFLRESINSVRTANGAAELDAVNFMKLVREKAKLVELPDKLLKRDVNSGFSGGEKKRNEILQMALLEPSLAILDETDSGLDIDALKIVSDGINRYHSESTGVLMVTHYQRLLNYVKPHFVHVMMHGNIVRSGGPELALKLEDQGYDWLNTEAA